MQLNTPLRNVMFASLLGLGALLASPAHAGDAKTPPTLLDGWEQHTRPLFHDGPGLNAGTYSWRVPAILPRGQYRVISRNGDKAEVIEGYSFEIDGSINKEIRLMLPSPYTGVEAVKAEYVSMK